MDFRIQTDIPKGLPQIGHGDELLLLGSCFAGNIGRLLTENKFRCDVNPFGILYNPQSVSVALRQILEGRVYTEADLFFHAGQYHSHMHHGSFSAPSAADALEGMNGRLRRAHENIVHTNRLIITLGTAWVYTLREDGRVVSNCHKQPAGRFARRRLEVEEIVSEYAALLGELFHTNAGLKVVLTVSPIRHIKDGLHGSQLGKAVLLLAVDRLCAMFPERLFYFPAYEIVIDELRDYRFYEVDMLHPSALAVGYIWERFAESFFSGATRTALREYENLRRAVEHKPFRPESDEYKIFLEQLVLKIKRLNEKYPYLDVQNELNICHTLLKR